MKPLRGIMETSDWGDAKTFRVSCDCHDPEHDVNMWIEVDGDADTKDVQVAFYVDTWTPFWDKKFNRFKAAWDILFKGVHRQQHHMILSKKAALNFADAIADTVLELDTREKS